MDDSDNNNQNGENNGNKVIYPSFPKKNRGLYQTKKVIYYVLSIIEVLLLFRLLFKLFGANPSNGFIVFLYALTKIFVAPFIGIFGSIITVGDGTQYIFEPATLVAMLVYAVIAWGLASLVKLRLTT